MVPGAMPTHSQEYWAVNGHSDEKIKTRDSCQPHHTSIAFAHAGAGEEGRKAPSSFKPCHYSEFLQKPILYEAFQTHHASILFPRPHLAKLAPKNVVPSLDMPTFLQTHVKFPNPSYEHCSPNPMHPLLPEPCETRFKRRAISGHSFNTHLIFVRTQHAAAPCCYSRSRKLALMSVPSGIPRKTCVSVRYKSIVFANGRASFEGGRECAKAGVKQAQQVYGTCAMTAKSQCNRTNKATNISNEDTASNQLFKYRV